jgi:hypothetical protein
MGFLHKLRATSTFSPSGHLHLNSPGPLDLIRHEGAREGAGQEPPRYPTSRLLPYMLKDEWENTTASLDFAEIRRSSPGSLRNETITEGGEAIKTLPMKSGLSPAD